MSECRSKGSEVAAKNKAGLLRMAVKHRANLDYTSAGASQVRMENKIGSIEMDEFADLVILNDNLFDMEYQTHG